MNALLPADPVPTLIPTLHDFEAITRSLELNGYAIIPDGLPEEVATELLAARDALHQDEFRTATIGRGQQQQKNREIRRDRIHWLDEREPELDRWRSFTTELKDCLNRRLFLGLFSFESHLAIYREGDFYKPHFDAFKGEANRQVSLVTYLNTNWGKGDGGELVLYPDSGPVIVTPAYRTLVLFLSEELLHEVKAANRTRYSVAGWFRINTSLLDRIDPPR